METKEQFKIDVMNKISRKDLCPIYVGLIGIANSHRCQEGWDLWWNHKGEMEYEKLVNKCVSHMSEGIARRTALINIFTKVGDH